MLNYRHDLVAIIFRHCINVFHQSTGVTTSNQLNKDVVSAPCVCCEWTAKIKIKKKGFISELKCFPCNKNNSIMSNKYVKWICCLF